MVIQVSDCREERTISPKMAEDGVTLLDLIPGPIRRYLKVQLSNGQSTEVLVDEKFYAGALSLMGV